MVGRWVRGASNDTPLARLVKCHRHIQTKSNAIPHHQRAADMKYELALHERGPLFAVWGIGDERLMGPIGNEARGGPQMAAEIERFEHEPVATSFGRLEAIERESGRLCRGEIGDG